MANSRRYNRFMAEQHIPYLGGEIVVAGRVKSGYVEVYAFPDADGSESMFGLKIRLRGAFSSAEDKYEATKDAGVSIAKAKVLLGTFKAGSVTTIHLESDLGSADVSGMRRKQVINMLGRALARRHDTGEITHLDIPGIANELGVSVSLVQTAVLHMRDTDLLEMLTMSNGVRLTAAGIDSFESMRESIGMFAGNLADDTIRRLDVIKPGLGQELSELLETTTSTGPSGRELIGYGNQIREFVKEATDQIYTAAGLGESPGYDAIKAKAAAVARLAGSKTSANHTSAIAASFEAHASSFNDVVQAAAHRRPVEAQRLALYAVMFLGEMLDAGER